MVGNITNLSVNKLLELIMDKDRLLKKLDAWRKGSNLTQQEIAEKLRVKQTYYSLIMSNPDMVSFERIKEMYEILGIDFDDVLIPDSKMSKEDIHQLILSLEEQNEKNTRIIEMLKNKLN